MHLTPTGLLHSATDLSNHLACAHLSALNRAVALELIGKPRVFEDPAAEVLRQRGIEHERAFLDALRAEGRRIVEIADPGPGATGPRDGEDSGIPARWARRAADTLAAMRSGADVIYQGCLFDGAWVGLPDFLLRVEKPSGLGAWSYEVVDAKLAREAKGGAVLQISLYSDLLAGAQGAAPELMGLALGGPDARVEPFRVADFAAYYRSAKARFEALMDRPAEARFEALMDGPAEAAGSGAPAAGRAQERALARAPEPVGFCQICRWRPRCDGERRDVDHLSLVAGISRGQRRALRGIDVTTMASLGALETPVRPRLDGASDASLQRVREQARIQVEGRERQRPLHELLSPVVEGEGLAALPEPSPGDLFFDIEADPYAFTHGLEYLFGYCDAGGDFTAIWALDPQAEKAAFERFVDLVMERRERWPGMHVYHYAHYETTALKRLMGRHATREDGIDALLRGRVFVDLHRVVKQGLRASVESYSIKKLEPFYGFAREVELRDANSALGHFEAWLELGGGRPRTGGDGGVGAGASDRGTGRGVGASDRGAGRAAPASDRGAGRGGPAERDLLDRIEGYNRDDCLSTLRLREWLESLRPELERREGAPVPRPTPESGDAPDGVAEEVGEVAELVERLTADVSAETRDMATGDVSAETRDMAIGDVSAETRERARDRHARWLLAQLLGFHRREAKSTWWEFFTRCAYSDDELIEDRATLGGLEYEGVVRAVKKSTIHRYRFPRQEHEFKLDDNPRDPATREFAGEVIEIDDVSGTIDLRRGNKSEAPHPRGLVPLDKVPDKALKQSLRTIARAVVEHGVNGGHPFRAAADLLVAVAPRLASGRTGRLARTDESALDAARRLALDLDRTVLPVQGPPGAGKTYTAARMIVSLLRARKRVGVTATSHKVITNLVDAVCEAAREEGFEFRGFQKGESGCSDPAIMVQNDNDAALEALVSGDVQLAAGTAWLWSRPQMQGTVDVLFVDEAGQFSLANAVAVSPAAHSLVLVGDPRQLDQPMQGTHPPGAGVSAMEHLLRGEATFPADRGLFLADTWRLHPDICRFTSEIFYRDRLSSRPGLENQRVDGPEPLNGSGVRFVAVETVGNTSESPEEVEAVGRLVAEALGGAADLRGGSADRTPGAKWTDARGETHALTLEDILIVAPYNLQVAALKEALPAGARVGTVDKFQGQEAPVVIYSMASSSAEDAPRGMGFLYSPNRLNVATSRAKCLAIVVASPAIFVPECRSPDQMRLANAFCRFRELAG